MICATCKNKFFTDYRTDNQWKKKNPPKYCSRECANRRVISDEIKEHLSKIQQKVPKQYCVVCGKDIGRRRKRNVCLSCLHVQKVTNRTKKSLFEESKNWQSARTTIRVHASEVYFDINKREYKCIICGYSHYVEVAHKKPVSDFSDEATLAEINHIDNLMGLCANHHWEFDNGILKIAG